MSSIFDLFGDDAEPAPVPPPPPKKAAPRPPERPPKKAAPPPERPPEAPVGPAEPEAPPPVTSTRCAVYLDCGHLNWHSDADNAAAESDGHCCANGKGRHQISWTHLRGKYVRPLPTSVRRTDERERSGGFPGYCCDGEGWYIGGIGNDCRFYGPDERRCAVHRPPSKSAPEPAVEKVAVEKVTVEKAAVEKAAVAGDTQPVEADPPVPRASGGSWKQRQLSAKRGRG